MAATRVPLTITYRLAGTQPPIFVAGEFSEPPWDPQEMEYTSDKDGEHTFTKRVLAKAGSKVQYKFRVGTGDWWVLDESAPTARDIGGFLNNVADVPAAASEQSAPHATPDEAKQIPDGNGNPDEQRHNEPTGTEAQEQPSLANAAKELRHRFDAVVGSGTNTPDFVRTAAEVADSAALLDKEENEFEEQPVANAAKELMKRLDPHAESDAGSGASTPGFVRTAAEVADSAALLDKEDPEPEVTDEEAGQTGFRRMSLTPIQDVAATAAEVADTAKDLDREPIPRLELRPTEYEDADPYGFDEPAVPDNKAPLFAHECVGMDVYEGDDSQDPPDDEVHEADYEEDRRPSTVVYDDDEDIDLNDPTLVKFPSNREEIIDTVRKLEGGLNEDHSDVEGLIPASPIVGPSGPHNHDLLGVDFLVSSPVVSSPVVARGSGSSGSRLLSLPRPSIGSVSSDRSSALSLSSISEAAEEAGDEDEFDRPPVLLTPKPRNGESTEQVKSPTSDDDEGIVMKNDNNNKNAVSREVSSYEDTPVRSPRGDGTPKPSETQTGREDGQGASSGTQLDTKPVPVSEVSADTSNTSGQTEVEVRSPCLFSRPEGGIQEPAIVREDESADRSASSSASNAKSPGVDDSAQSQLRRRVAGPDRVATPNPVHEAGVQAAKNGSWIRSFFRMLFVDWIGGFINRLCGGKRETLLAAGAAGILLGAAWWRGPGK